MRNLTLFIFLFLFGVVDAQTLSVQSFQILENDLDARVHHPVKDQNGDLAALIKVVTTQIGFSFDVGSLGVVKTVQKNGEIWVYVPEKVQRITISHKQLGVLRNYEIPLAIQKASVYELVLYSGKIETIIKEAFIETEWIAISSNPEGANVFLNDRLVGKTPFQGQFPLGVYNYKVELIKHHTEAGRLELSDDKVVLNLALKPKYGAIQINTNPENGMQIYLDNENTGKTSPAALQEISSGPHTVKIISDWFAPQSKTVTVEDGKTAQLDFKLIPEFAEISINSNSNAAIYINSLRKGNASFNGRLLSGVYNLKVEADKFHTHEQQLIVEPGKNQNINIELKAITGSLSISSIPFEAKILLNGQSYGTTPKTIKNLQIGSYTLELHKEDYGIFEQQLEIKEGSIVEVIGELTLLGAILVQSETPKTEVYLNGEFKGFTPIEISELKAGIYEVELRKAGYEVFSRKVVIESGTVEQIKAKLNEASSTLTVTSNPTTAMLYIDNCYEGYTPLKVSALNSGLHTVELKYGGYIPLKRKIHVKTDENVTINYSMRPNKETRKSKQVGSKFFMYTYEGNNPIGISMGKLDLRRAGYYFNFKFNTHIFTPFDGYYTINNAGEFLPTTWDYYGIRTGEIREGSVAFSGGVTFKVIYPCWGYIGGGLGYFPFYEYVNRYYYGSFTEANWYRNVDQSKFGFFPEAGLITKLMTSKNNALIFKFGGVLYNGLRPQFGICFRLK